MSVCQLVYNCRQPECGTGVEIVKVKTLVVSYFSVINISLGWPSVALALALALEPRVTKPLEHLITCTTELMESKEGRKKKTRGDRDKSRGEEEEKVGVRRKKGHLKITSILEKRRRRWGRESFRALFLFTPHSWLTTSSPVPPPPHLTPPPLLSHLPLPLRSPSTLIRPLPFHRPTPISPGVSPDCSCTQMSWRSSSAWDEPCTHVRTAA